ncbi:MmyB family transcriptional regulator [Streptomyces sp. NPDC002206]
MCTYGKVAAVCVAGTRKALTGSAHIEGQAGPVRNPRRRLARLPTYRNCCMWADHDVQAHTTGTKRLHHPLVGDLALDYVGAVAGRLLSNGRRWVKAASGVP